MTFMLIMSIITIIITSLLMMISIIISKKTLIDREKSSPFECGFDPMSSARSPFSLRFFLIAVIFLIFDVEIALILPVIIILNHSDPMSWTITLFFFIMILIIGLYHEWTQGALNWA